MKVKIPGLVPVDYESGSKLESSFHFYISIQKHFNTTSLISIRSCQLCQSCPIETHMFSLSLTDTIDIASKITINTVDLNKNTIICQARCSVCGDAAATHLHYGAVSCYSCRAFFRCPKQIIYQKQFFVF